MTYRMGDLRNLGINLYYYISSGLNNNGYTILSGYSSTYVNSGIYLVGSFPDDYDFNNIRIPSISIDHTFSRDDYLQLGPGRKDIRRYNIDIYAGSNGEMDDLGELVRNFFYNTMNIYDYNQVFSDGTYQKIGFADFKNINMFPTRDSSFKTTKFRMRIAFECEITVPSGNSLL